MIITYNYIFILFVFGIHSLLHGIWNASIDCETPAIIKDSLFISSGIIMIGLVMFQITSAFI